MMSMRRVLYFRLAICRRLLSQRTSICFSPPEGAIRHVLAKVRLCSSQRTPRANLLEDIKTSILPGPMGKRAAVLFWSRQV